MLMCLRFCIITFWKWNVSFLYVFVHCFLWLVYQWRYTYLGLLVVFIWSLIHSFTFDFFVFNCLLWQWLYNDDLCIHPVRSSFVCNCLRETYGRNIFWPALKYVLLCSWWNCIIMIFLKLKIKWKKVIWSLLFERES